MRRRLAPLVAFVAFVAFVATACSRDVDLPTTSPPRIDSVAVVGLELDPQVVASNLSVLGGELVAIRGGGFPSDTAELEVRIGGTDAEVLDLAQDRIVARVPSLATFGLVDLQVRTASGFRTQADAFRYDGAGQPFGFGTSELPTEVPIGFVSPIQPPGPSGFSDLAIAIGASDSALLVVPAVGVAVTSIPLGLVPVSAAARLVDAGGGNLRIEVLALGRGGEVALGTANLDVFASVVNRFPARPLTSLVTPQACSNPQVMFTASGLPVAAWTSVTGEQRIATIDSAAATTGAGEYKPRSGVVLTVPEAIVGWVPSMADSVSVAFAAGDELYTFDAQAATTAVLTMLPGGLGAKVTDRIEAECGGAPISYFYTLAAATHDGSSAIAVGYRTGTMDRVALVDLTMNTVRVGVAGTIPTSLALAPDPPFAAPTSWAVLVGGITNLYRFRPLPGADACSDLVADAAMPLSSTPGALPTFGGMTLTANGTRLLATTPDRDLITVLPPSLTSAGPVLRLASYGGVSIQQATIGGTVTPIAVAEHQSTSTLSIDTGSALLVVSLAADHGSVALGGSGYGRGAVWLDAPVGGTLAYTGDLPKAGLSPLARGGAAAVTGFASGQCAGENVRIEASRPMTNGPELVAQGPARAGTLGPAGIARFGPSAPPVYAISDARLAVYVPDNVTTLGCLAGEDPLASPNWDATQLGTCAPNASIELGVDPLDVTLSAGDRTAALRTLDSTCISSCLLDDVLCLRARCPAASELVLVAADPAAASSVTVALPTPPAGIAADRGGGFLVTLPCTAAATPGGACFPATTLCDGFLTGRDGDDGALVLVAEDGSSVECLAVLPALAGPVAVTPNGVEAWVTGMTPLAQRLSRLALPRRASDGAIDATLPAERVAFEPLGLPAAPTGAFPPGGIAFTPDGSTGIVTVPGEFRILLLE
jgi:hypothetical protein